MVSASKAGTQRPQRTDTGVTAEMRARIRAGDSEALGELFDEHAEDVVSLTFLEAWRIRESLRPDGDSLRPWLLGIATNVLRNRRRAARRHREALRRLPVRDTVPDFADAVVDRMHDADQVAAAMAELRALRRADREVFLLCVWSQLDYAAAAEALGVPVGTVRSRLSRARTRLRALAQQELAGTRMTPVEQGEYR
ncbi:hypothetical protein LUPAC07_00197 [Micromonospora noduli]|nr:hypothetical protein LUPAC07_00197 [Micromonospora noduli]